jgi:Ca2+-binding RTX toxin-like protein
MKSFSITLSDLSFLSNQVSVPIISIVRYLINGTPIYGYKVPTTGFINPLTGQAFLNNLDPATNQPLPAAGSTVELGAIGTFDVFNTPWAYFLPPVVTAAGITAAGVGEPFGLRNVQGVFNNITLSSSAIWGAAFYAFARTSDAEYGNYLKQRIKNVLYAGKNDPLIAPYIASTDRTKAVAADQTAVNVLNADLNAYLSNPNAPGVKLWSQFTNADKALVQDSTYGVRIDANGNIDLSNRYANPFLTVYDATPRSISQLVDSQAALERVDAASIAADPINGGYFTDNLTYDVTDVTTALVTHQVTEKFQRNLNTLGGDPSLSGWNTLFGQFFDHGLDFIGKGGNTTLQPGQDGVLGTADDVKVGSKIYIPLDPSDPLYRAPVYDTGGNLIDPGNTKLSISRATVANPDAAGADGLFRTADDIQSPGADHVYGTSDDIIGPTNPTYINHTSPYIDQSQTYGSDDTVTNLLRQWVETSTPNVYTPGMYLFDGKVLDNPWIRQNPDGTSTSTNQTLPTLNELRAELLKTGRDDLSWGDIDNLRVRNNKGNVLTSSGVDGIVGNADDTAGLAIQFTGHTLIADFLPRIDADHLFSSATVVALKAAPGYVDPLAGFNATLIQRTSGIADGTYISDYVNLQSGQPTAGVGTFANGSAIFNEVLLRSIGDHYVAGDGRANENFGLTAIHHVWHEDHNWQVDNLINIIGQQQSADPSHTVAHNFQVNTGFQDSKGNYVYSGGTEIAWDQEKVFQASVLIVQTEYQHVAIDQYARGLSPNIPLFVQYDSGVNPDISIEYSQGAFRFGHSQLRETIDTLDPNGSLTGAITHYALEQAFLNPAGFAKTGPAAIALGQTRQVSNEIDEILTPSLQQNLLGQATDLAAINIARGRDLGIPTLNNLRRQLSSGLTTELNALNQKLIAHPGDATLRETIDKTIALQAGLQAYSSWADFGINIQHPESLVNFIAAYSFDGGNAGLRKAELVVGLADGSLTYGTLSTTASIDTNGDGVVDSSDASDNQLVTNSVAAGGLGWNFGSSDIGYTIAANQFLNGGDKGYEAVDAWNGGLAEKHVFLGELGPTFDAIFADQITRLINGDRFYYFWRLQLGLPIFAELSSAVTTEQFKDVIERTTGAKHLVGDVFFMADSYVEVSETHLGATDSTPGIDRDHKYGDLLAKNNRVNYDGTTTSLLDANNQHIGVASIGGTSEALNGYVTSRITGQNASGVNIVEQFILDVRPDQGTNPDGTASKGFNAHEVIGGTQYRDYIDAGDGDDTIYGDAGNDILVGNAGADHIYGEVGNDLIYGGTLPDFLDGGVGDDEIHGGDDADVLIGSEGNDRLFGENFTDELHGNTGDDYLDGGLDADFIFAGEGQDVVVGGEGLDTTYGEWGDDRMFGGAGPDQLFGGYGDDILNAGFGGQNQNVNVDEALGEFGFNLISFSDITVPLNHSADLNQENINISNVTPFGQLWVNIQGVEGSQFNDELIGYNGSGTVDATLIGNWLIGASGNDTITTGSGDDIIVGDSVRLDYLIGSYQKDTSGNLLLDVNGNPTLRNDGLLDTLYGPTAGLANKHFKDLLKSVPDFTFGDTVAITANGLVYTHQATPGIDTAIYAGNRSNFNVTLINNSDYTQGFKIIDNTGVETGPNGDIVLGIENFKFGTQTFTALELSSVNGSVTVSGFASANQPANVNTFQLTATLADPDGIIGTPVYSWQYSTNGGTSWTTVVGAANSTFKPINAGVNSVPLGATIRSVVTYTDGAGNVGLVVNSAPTQPMGQYISVNTATINGTAFQDVIIGGNAANTINGGDGNDYLSGGAGSDTLVGGLGNDTLVGGTGSDTFRVDFGTDVITDLSGADVLVVSPGATANATVTAAFTATAATNNTGTANLTSNGFAVNLRAATGSNGFTVTNTGGAATFTSSVLNDTFTGGIGNDTFVYRIGDGVDAINGGAGIDTLTITGLANNDLLNVIWNGTSITGFQGGTVTGVELINANLGGNADTISYAGSSAGVSVTLGNGNNTSGTASGFNTLSSVLNAIGTDQNDTLTGNTGANILDGGGGNDTLLGGTGNDTLLGGLGNDILVGGVGADLLTGGLGNDVFRYDANNHLGATAAVSDRITDFTLGDIINLTGIDANTNNNAAGDQAFTFIGTGSFTGVGQLRYTTVGADTVIQLNTAGNLTPDLFLTLTGAHTLTSSDFLL